MTTINFTEAEWRQDKKGTWLSVLVDSPSAAKQFCETQEPGKKYTAEFRERRKKRSLDANAYCWVLIGQLVQLEGTTTSPPSKMMLCRATGRSGRRMGSVGSVRRWAAVSLTDTQTSYRTTDPANTTRGKCHD